MDLQDVIVAVISALTGGGGVVAVLRSRDSRAGAESERESRRADLSRSHGRVVELARREDAIRREAQLELAVANLAKAIDDLVRQTDEIRNRVHAHSEKLKEHEMRLVALERETPTGPHRTLGG